jgi:TetR/AcrR family transcriptional repressor of mexJK operon
LLAAKHFAFLILGTPLDKAMFYGDDTGFTDEELERFADEGVRVFLKAYRVDPS